MRRYQEWKDRRTARIEAGERPAVSHRDGRDDGLTRAEAESIAVETVTLPPAPGRPTGRKFGRVVHDILQRADRVDEVDALARIWGRRHAATEQECAAAAVAARAALEHRRTVRPAGSAALSRSCRCWCVWKMARWSTAASTSPGRTERNGPSSTTRRIAARSAASRQLQLYGLALQRATGLPVRGIVLEV